MRSALQPAPALARSWPTGWPARSCGRCWRWPRWRPLVWRVIDPSRAVWVAVSVLIVTCPCALSLAAPAALLAAAGALARRGVLLQRLEALEALARVDTAVHRQDRHADRRPRWQLRRCASLRRTARAARRRCRIALAAGRARWPAHVAAIRLSRGRWSQPRALGGAGGRIAAAGRDVDEMPGRGLQARGADGQSWRLGARAWVRRRRRRSRSVRSTDAARSVWFGADGQALRRFDFDEALRDDAARGAWPRLRGAGLRVALLSGDRADACAGVWRARLGIDDALGGATPQDKLDDVAAAQARGPTWWPWSATASTTRRCWRAPMCRSRWAQARAGRAPQADAVLLGQPACGDRAVALAAGAPHACASCARTWPGPLAYNVACVPLALLGWLPPWAAGLGMALSSLAGVLNALRAARIERGSDACMDILYLLIPLSVRAGAC